MRTFRTQFDPRIFQNGTLPERWYMFLLNAKQPNSSANEIVLRHGVDGKYQRSVVLNADSATFASIQSMLYKHSPEASRFRHTFRFGEILLQQFSLIAQLYAPPGQYLDTSAYYDPNLKRWVAAFEQYFDGKLPDDHTYMVDRVFYRSPELARDTP